MRQMFKWLTLILYGGVIYSLIESVYKHFVSGGSTHWTMAVLGGIMFLLIGGINNFLPWNMSLILQSLLGATLITSVEFVAGIVLNIWLGLGIWDYSHLPFNILGQVCLPFYFVWIGLSLVAIWLDDYLRYWLWGEEKPHYHLL